MSTQAANKRDPQFLAEQFLFSFYTALSEQPHTLHQFYKADSTLSHGWEGEESATCKGLDQIKQRYSQLDFVQPQTDISSIDAQFSLQGSLLVSLTGTMINKEGVQRRFFQSFFLATQEHGFYVLNDILRFLKEGDKTASPNVTSTPHVTTPVAEETKPKQEPERKETVAPPKAVETPKEEAPKVAQTSTSATSSAPAQVASRAVEIEDAKPSTPAAQTAPQSQPATQQVAAPAQSPAPKQEPPKQQQPAGEVSWASRVRTTPGAPQAVPAPAVSAPAPAVSAPSKPAPQQKAPKAEKPQGEKQKSDKDVYADNGVFLRNLPFTTTEETIRKEFGKYGKIKHLNLQKGFAFLDFDTPQAAQALLDAANASPMSLESRPISVERRKREDKKQLKNEGKTGKKFNNTQGNYNNNNNNFNNNYSQNQNKQGGGRGGSGGNFQQKSNNAGNGF